MARLKQLSRRIGKTRLVLDLSCRKRGDAYLVATDRWQTFTTEAVTYRLLDRLSDYCDEFLIHAVDVEGRCAGIETDLVAHLGRWEGLPVTYAGGISNQQDIDLIESMGNGNIDFTVGSALDIFGGSPDFAMKTWPDDISGSVNPPVDTYNPSPDRPHLKI
jgi:phosphoribosylformimino-5-aminoimidazole carboxamide ribotide isomerase